MCLAIPSKIVAIENNVALIDVEGIQRKASLLLLEDAQVGDYIIVHAGFALHKIDEAAAKETIQILRDAVARGHKFALEDIPHGGNITKYGHCIGLACSDIAAGAHVHLHNIEGLAGRAERRQERT